MDLLEREGEIAEVDGALSELTRGAGRLIVIEGAPGMGKSALLESVAERGGGAGARVLGAVGGELEREFPFGMVRQLLEPLVRGASEERRAELLSGVSASAGPIVGGTHAEPSADTGFATLHGLYWLVAALADDAPLVLLFDDAHWADAPSLRFLDFLARRVADLPVLVAAAMRPGEPGAEQLLLDTLIRQAGSGVLRPGLLSEAGVRSLLEARVGARAGAGVVTAAHAATGGNPLLLRELIRTLATRDDPLTAGLVREVLPSSVTRSVQLRLAAMGEADRDVAVALAVLGERSGADLLAAASGHEPGEVADALDALRSVELVGGDPPVYTHPLLRQAVGESTSRSQRDALHRAAADHLRRSGGGEDELLAHLLAAPPLDEEWARTALREGGLRAMAEGAADIAVTRLSRALESASDDPDPRLVLELGLALMLTGQPAVAATRLRRAEQSGDAEVAAEAVKARVGAEILIGSEGNAALADALTDALDRLPATGAEELVDELLGKLCDTLTLDRRLAARRADMFERLRAAPAIVSAPTVSAWEMAAGHADASDVRDRAATALATRPLQTVRGLERGTAFTAVVACHIADGRDIADQGLRDAEATARRSGSRLGAAHVAAIRAEWELAFGSAARAEANAQQALELWRAMGLQIMVNTSSASLATALVRMDRLDEAAEAIAGADLDENSYTSCIAWQASAALHVARGEHTSAVADLEAVQELCDALDWRRFPRQYPGAEMAVALAGAGRREEGIAAAREEAELAERTGRASLRVAALTALGMACGEDEGLLHLAAAVELSPQAESPFVRAAAAVEYGAAPRRAGRRAEARDQLRAGGELAARAAARALENRALEELSIAGARQRDPFSSGLESLTPSERRVAEHAARGLTNREIAETLFVTQKTVEFHLGKTYAKLEIRSRGQLATALGGEVTP